MILLLLSAALAAEPEVHGDHILVRAAPGVRLVAGERLVGGAWIERELRGLPGWYMAGVPSRPREHAAEARQDLRLETAEPDARLYLLGWEDEPSFDEQWALESAPTRGAVFDADLDVTDAWSLGATGEGVVVAIVDTGVDLDHPDLAPALWVNVGEIPDNGIDDDGNGYVDDVHGIDAVHGTGDPDDTEGHGTSCAGLVASQPDGRSTVGVAPDAQIMAVRIFGGSGGFASIAAEGITYATLNGADIISNSWHYGQSQQRVVTDALELAEDADVLVPCAAGNTPLDADELGFYPARTSVDAVLSVGGSTRLDELVYFPGLWGSAWGDETVDLVAPAESTLTTHLGGGYGDFSGTSAATPLAAGAAALVWSVDPQLEVWEVKDLLMGTVDPNGLETVSGGRVNAGAAVRQAVNLTPPLQPVIVVEEGGYRVEGPSDAQWTWWFQDDGSFAEGEEVQHELLPGPWRVVVEGVRPGGARGRASLTGEEPITWVDGDEILVESEHDGQPRYGVAVLEQRGAVWTRYHFDRIGMVTQGWEVEDDWVAIWDEHGLVRWSYTGEAEDLWTPPLPGEEHLLVWSISDWGSFESSWGFVLDGQQLWIPVDEPVDTGQAAEEPGGCGCGGGWGLSAPWLVLVLTVLGIRRVDRVPSSQ